MVDAPALGRAVDRTAAAASRRPVAGASAGAALTLTVVGGAVVSGVGWQALVDTYTLTNTVIGLGFLVPGVGVLAFRRRHVIGGLMLACGLAHLASAAATVLGFAGLDAGWPTWVVRTLSTVAIGGWQLSIASLFPLALLLFPDGRLPSRRWRPVAWLLVASGAYQALTGVLSDGSLFTGVLSDGSVLRAPVRTDSVLSVGLVVPDAVSSSAGAVHSLGYVAVIASLVLRYRRGDDRTRRQLLWLILAVIGILAVNLQRTLTGDGPILLLLSVVLLPAAVGVAVARHELFDIRVVLSRTLLYGLTLSVVVAVYAGSVAGLSSFVPSEAGRGVSVSAAIAVAILFTPVRLFLQQAIDRAFYGSRSDPVATAESIGQGLRSEDDLAGVLDRTRLALRLSQLTLRREPDGAELATAGAAHDGTSTELPLEYRGARTGTLTVGLRRGERQLHASDRRTLELIATPLAVALHATELRDQVQAARTATVEAGAAERARLQRELHDGLGPTLTSVTFQADAASNLVRSDAEGAARLLHDVRMDLRQALDDLRRVVYGLRPIELGTLGLLGAVRERAAALHRDGRPCLDVQVVAPEQLPGLSPAVELAAYRIVAEALTNVVRHSDARSCVVTVSAGDDLAVTVRDDGHPPASWRSGVGLLSITDRAEELGGEARAAPVDGGWEVVARLPLRRSTDVT